MAAMSRPWMRMVFCRLGSPAVMGETAAEVAGFAQAMRGQMVRVDAGADIVDNCGTGGDQSGTFNISTTAAFVLGFGIMFALFGVVVGYAGSMGLPNALDVLLDAERQAQERRQQIGMLRAVGATLLQKPVAPARLRALIHQLLHSAK